MWAGAPSVERPRTRCGLVNWPHAKIEPDRFDKAVLTLHSPAARPPNEAIFMVSETTQTKRRRHNRDQRLGVKRKRRAKREGTPSFPLDPASGINTSARSKTSG